MPVPSICALQHLYHIFSPVLNWLLYNIQIEVLSQTNHSNLNHKIGREKKTINKKNTRSEGKKGDKDNKMHQQEDPVDSYASFITSSFYFNSFLIVTIQKPLKFNFIA